MEELEKERDSVVVARANVRKKPPRTERPSKSFDNFRIFLAGPFFT